MCLGCVFILSLHAKAFSYILLPSPNLGQVCPLHTSLEACCRGTGISSGMFLETRTFQPKTPVVRNKYSRKISLFMLQVFFRTTHSNPLSRFVCVCTRARVFVCVCVWNTKGEPILEYKRLAHLLCSKIDGLGGGCNLAWLCQLQLVL